MNPWAVFGLVLAVTVPALSLVIAIYVFCGICHTKLRHEQAMQRGEESVFRGLLNG